MGVGNYRIQSYGVKGGGRLGGWESGVFVSFRCLIDDRIGRYV